MADQQALHNFTQWVAGCGGNEKQEAQTFVQRLLRAWGWEDATEAGVCFEQPIPGAGPGGGQGFADALIPGKVLIEMKSRGESLALHYPQLWRYWSRLTPKPTYAILCNFDQLWIYDFNKLNDEPVDELETAQLVERWGGLTFLGREAREPLFGGNQIEITEKQAGAMGSLFRELREQGNRTGAFAAQEAQRFVLQCVLCMFAEDRGMLADQQFSMALESCRENRESTFDVLGGLFTAMNTPGVTPGGRYKGTPYFNGGLFASIPQIELSPSQLDLLISSARENWKKIRPSIFGNIFEASSDDARRHSLGQHFTSEPDILKVIHPTIIEPWERRVEATSRIDDLDRLLFELTQYRVLDPACGSGNFLYMAYNGLKDIEALILRKIRESRRSEARKDQGVLGYVTTNQLHGIDTDPFAVELARVTLMIARKVAHDRLGLTEQELPLDNLDKNIVQGDALFSEWPAADAIVGNPPFLGGKHMRLNLGDDYIDRVFKRFPDVQDSVDFCSYWFRLAHDALGDDGHAGLVATNSIRHGKSRRATLDYIKDHGGFIHSAVSTQPWSGEANVHVSIVNWSRQKPETCRLDDQDVPVINTSLRSTTDVTAAARLQANRGFCFQGVIPVGKGFNVEEETARAWIEQDRRNAEVVKPFSMGTNLAKNPMGKPDRWIIDFADMSLEEIEAFPLPYRQVAELVKPERQNNREQVMREKWWRFKRTNAAMREALAPLVRFFAVPEVSKWAIFVPCQPNWLCGNKNKAVATDDFYVLGILTSGTHRSWMHAQKGTLEDRTAYTHDTCFETFPFPQQLTAKQAEAIRQQMITLNNYRNTWMVEHQKGITGLYNRYFDEPASKLRQLHDGLDALVLKAYGWKRDEDILANLLDLNLELAAREAEGLPVIGPWDPSRPR